MNISTDTLNIDFSHPEANLSSLMSWFQGTYADNLVEKKRYSTPLNMWEQTLFTPIKKFLSTPGKSLRRTFIQLGWELSHGIDQVSMKSDFPPCPEPLLALIELLHTGSLIIDDIEDQSTVRRGKPSLHLQIGLAPALNLGNWLYFVASSMIEQLEVNERVQLHLYKSLNRIMLRCHQGQALDVGCQVHTISREHVHTMVHRSTQLKTGTLVGYALQLGAIYQGKSSEQIQALYTFGEQVGQALQMYDDLSGIINPKRKQKGREDLQHMRLTWVWAWLAQHPHLDQDRYQELSQIMQYVAKKLSSNIQKEQEQGQDTENLIHTFKQKALPYLPKSGVQMNQLIDQATFNLQKSLGFTHNVQLNQIMLRLKTSYL